MTLWRVFRHVDACARNNHRLEVSRQIGKMALTRRTRNFQMELEVASGASEARGGLAILEQSASKPGNGANDFNDSDESDNSDDSDDFQPADDAVPVVSEQFQA